VRSIPILAALVLAAPHARATPGFPDAVRAHLALDATPQCQLCHTDGGNSGTATQPFALSMLERGLLAFDVASLEFALDAMDADGVDSDGDGATDVQELREGGNPNVDEGGGGAVPPTLQYGFGCAGAPHAPDLAASGLFALGLWLARRRCAIGAIERKRIDAGADKRQHRKSVGR
jgi:hypothetical protein